MLLYGHGDDQVRHDPLQLSDINASLVFFFSRQNFRFILSFLNFDEANRVYYVFLICNEILMDVQIEMRHLRISMANVVETYHLNEV